jgi:ribosomal protein L18
MSLGRHVKCQIFVSDFNQIWVFSTDFNESLRYQISRKSVQSEPSYNIGADIAKLVTSRNYANAPKNWLWTGFNWLRTESGGEMDWLICGKWAVFK